MIQVNHRQRGNNVLEYLTKTSYHFEDNLACDYLINNTTAILFLCCRFHVAKPEYIYKRLRKTKDNAIHIKIILLLIDVENYDSVICEMFSIADFYNHTLIVVFSNEEAAFYLSSFATAKNCDLATLRPKNENIIEHFFKGIESVTKRDVEVLMKHSHCIKHFLSMSVGEMEKIPGIGRKKAETIHKYLNQNFT